MATKYSRDQPSGFSNRVERVAITGAGGQFGKHLTSALLRTGRHVVTAIARPNSSTPLPHGVHVTHVDYNADDDTTLVAALRGQQALIITMSVSAPPDTIGKLVRAAAKAGVAYVLPNWFGHDPANDALCFDSFLGERRDSLVKEFERPEECAYMMLACGFWYEFSLGGGADRYGFDFRKRTLTWFDDGHARITTSTWPQCGRAVANLLSLKRLPEHEDDLAPTLSHFRNQTVYISSFRVSQREMFESVKRVTDTTDQDWKFAKESAVQRWKEGHAAVEKGNWGEFSKQLYSRAFFPNGDGDFESRVKLHNDLLALPVEALDEWTAIAVRMGEGGEVSTEGRAVHSMR